MVPVERRESSALTVASNRGSPSRFDANTDADADTDTDADESRLPVVGF
jgi:hypothetical protein